MYLSIIGVFVVGTCFLDFENLDLYPAFAEKPAKVVSRINVDKESCLIIKAKPESTLLLHKK